MSLTSNSDGSATFKTKTWIKDYVIKKNHCPYAAKPFDADIIRYLESVNVDSTMMTEDFIDEINFIDKSLPQELSTSFLIFTKLEMIFSEFYEMTLDCEDILEAIGLSHKFQIVAFHPGFVFVNTEQEKKINDVNRSPYPMIHILRVEEVAAAIQSKNETYE
jgi:hypothetical protein